MEATINMMSGALAHEIKNPAAAALAHVNLMRLEEAVVSNKALTLHLNHIEQALTDICGLVREMLYAVYNPEEALAYEVDAYEILAEILETYRAAWPGISFGFNVAEVCTLGLGGTAVLPCVGQDASVRIIFSNLIKNAVEAVETAQPFGSGEIEINAKYSTDFLNITICDNGNFDNDEKPLGNGLGLTICRSLAEGIGATLSVNHAESGGCIAEVSLLCCPPQELTHCLPFA